VGCGKDHTLFAKADGTVVFETKGPKNRKYVRRGAGLSSGDAQPRFVRKAPTLSGLFDWSD
jgi:hypothetical protein